VLLTLVTLVPAVGAPTSVDLPRGPGVDGGITPTVRRIRLSGVDGASVATAAEVAPPARVAALTVAGVDPGPLDARPEVLTTEVPQPHFDAIGVTWAADGEAAPPAVWIRVREARGWSNWHLMPAVDLRPDLDSEEQALAPDREATEPLLTTGAEAFQVRIDAARTPRDLRAEIIDAGRPSDARSTRRSSKPMLVSATAQSSSAELTTPEATLGSTSTANPVVAARPEIISRAGWGADESLRSSDPTYSSSIKVGVIHHTATTNSYDASTAPAQIRSIYAYHTQSLGWSDIAYNFLVDRSGRVYEGRAGGIDRAVLSAATGGFNRDTFSVSALGNFEEIGAPAAMTDAIARLMAWKFTIHYVNPLGSSQLTSAGADTARYPAGQVVTVPNVMAHRDTNLTSCPGRYLYSEVDQVRARIKELMPAGLDHPSSAVQLRTSTANGSVRIKSGMLYGGNWSLTVTDASGAFVHRFVGVGQSVDVTWAMTTPAGLPVPEGTYHLRLLTEQNGATAHPFDLTVSTSALIGQLDGLGLSPQGVTAFGWAAVSNGAVATVALTTDGGDVVRVAANQPRADVGAARPDLGPLRGFSVPRGMAVGRHLVCAWAESPGLPSVLIGCRTIDNPPNEPIGHVDAVQPLYGGVRVTGWMLDRHTVDPITARMYVLPPRFAGDWTASVSRPDIASAFPAYGARHGFSADVQSGPGSKTVCVNGLNVGPGSPEGHLQCVVGASITGLPIGSVDRVQQTGSSISAAGWTFDPDTTSPINVHVYVDGAFRGAFAANVSRPDLQAYFPMMGTGHGYDVAVGGVGPGTHTVCVYAISAGPPGENPQLGCRTTG
jgi:hypothetical protein